MWDYKCKIILVIRMISLISGGYLTKRVQLQPRGNRIVLSRVEAKLTNCERQFDFTQTAMSNVFTPTMIFDIWFDLILYWIYYDMIYRSNVITQFAITRIKKKDNFLLYTLFIKIALNMISHFMLLLLMIMQYKLKST